MKLGECLQRVRDARPMVHCISNLVSANDCANVLLACGASPIMAQAAQEVEEITSLAASLVLNLGTLDEGKIRAMLKAGKRANALGHPVVFDPVGVGSSRFRKVAAKHLLEEVQCSVIRGNASEIASLWNGKPSAGGVDSDGEEDVMIAQALAAKYRCIVVQSGAVDVVTDGQTRYRVYNGHPMLKLVTGSGCMLSALLGAFVGANDNALQGSLAAATLMGLAGETAQRHLQEGEGPGMLRLRLMDALYTIGPEDLEIGARYA